MITVRHESTADAPGVRRVNEEAFGGPAEAILVETLRKRGAVALSLVAVEDAVVVGHILFTPAEIVSEGSTLPAAALAPMAVLPERQRQGIGSRLVERGIEMLRADGHRALVVLGHPEYYPRFGFAPASRFGVGCTFDVPDEVFMILELQEGVLGGRGGTVHYRPEFNEA